MNRLHCGLLGVLGVFLTLAICILIDSNDTRYWLTGYHVSTWDVVSHLWFFAKYLLCGTEILSVLLLLRTVNVPLFPVMHSNSTLAIYEWHWPLVTLLTWGDLPYTEISYLRKNQSSVIVQMLASLPPLLAFVSAHVLVYAICCMLGNNFAWRLLQYVSAPQSGQLLLMECEDEIYENQSLGSECGNPKSIQDNNPLDEERVALLHSDGMGNKF